VILDVKYRTVAPVALDTNPPETAMKQAKTRKTINGKQTYVRLAAIRLNRTLTQTARLAVRELEAQDGQTN
jgi:hypothetical protein